jgi:hypothetical protein
MTKKRCIKKLFAFITSDEKGEGIMALKCGQAFFPMVAGDQEYVTMFARAAKAVAKTQKYQIVEFPRGKIVTKKFLK